MSSNETAGGNNPSIVNSFIEQSQKTVDELNETIQRLNRDIDEVGRLNRELQKIESEHELVNAMTIDRYVEDLKLNIKVLNRKDLDSLKHQVHMIEDSLSTLRDYFENNYKETIISNNDEEKFDWF